MPAPAYAAVLLLTGLILVMGLYPEPFITPGAGGHGRILA